MRIAVGIEVLYLALQYVLSVENGAKKRNAISLYRSRPDGSRVCCQARRVPGATGSTCSPSPAASRPPGSRWWAVRARAGKCLRRPARLDGRRVELVADGPIDHVVGALDRLVLGDAAVRVGEARRRDVLFAGVSREVTAAIGERRGDRRSALVDRLRPSGDGPGEWSAPPQVFPSAARRDPITTRRGRRPSERGSSRRAQDCARPISQPHRDCRTGEAGASWGIVSSSGRPPACAITGISPSCSRRSGGVPWARAGPSARSWKSTKKP